MNATAGDSLAERLRAVQFDIADAAQNAGRRAEELTTVVVTKFHPASMVRELALLGVRDFGESRHQEARSKAADTADLNINWHFVGQVQGKKARQITDYAQFIHSVDRESLVDALESGERSVGCFLQINLTDDPARGGVAPEGLERLATRTLSTPGIQLLGVMAVAPLGVEPRRAFARVRQMSDVLRALSPNAKWISAGMSGDYRDAILEGATHLRIGTAITGNRPDHG